MATKKRAKKKAPTKTKRKKTASKAAAKSPSKKRLSPKASSAVKKAADAIWDAGTAPHTLLKELHELLLLRCLDEADGNYAAAAERFGPSRQSVQQYANSSLRDSRWRKYQQNRRGRR
jgi:hypothetical protein